MSYFRNDIDAMPPYVPGEQPQLGKFIKLNTNENPYPRSPSVDQSILAALQQGLGRYPDPLATAFRQRAAEVLQVDPDWIVCGNGSDDILTILTRSFVGHGEKIRLPYPSYILYRTLAQIQGAKWQEVSFLDDWSLGEEFSRATDDLKLVFLANPNSPSGTRLSADQVMEIADRLPCPLVVDEAYVEFADSDCLSLVMQQEKIIITRSMSKSYSLAGLRFGYLVAQPQIAATISKVKDSYNCDALAIAGATAAIDDQLWLQETRGKIISTRERMSLRLRELGFHVTRSEANFVWCTGANVPLQTIYEQLKASRILVRYMEYPDWGNGLRISVGTDDQVDACLGLLETMV